MAPDGRLVAVSAGPQVTVFDLVARQRVWVLATVGTESPHLAIHGDTLAAAVSDPPCVTLWDLRTGQELARLDELDYMPTSIAFSPDGTRLIATGKDAEGAGRIWEWKIQER
jgi:WD40 repeat protein